MNCKKCNDTGCINTHPIIALIEKNNEHIYKKCNETGLILNEL